MVIKNFIMTQGKRIFAIDRRKEVRLGWCFIIGVRLGRNSGKWGGEGK